MTVDVYPGDVGEGGRLDVVLASVGSEKAIDLSFDLETLVELHRDAWYRLAYAMDGGAGQVTVNMPGDHRPVLEVQLSVDPTSLQTSPDEACLQSSLASAEASVLIDNLSVDR